MKNKNCACGNPVSVKSLEKGRVKCYSCTDRANHAGVTITTYRAERIVGGYYTIEDLPSAPQDFAEFCNMIGGFK